MNTARSLSFAALALSLGIGSAFADDTRRAPAAETAIETLAHANSAARHQPTRNGFEEARHVYAYEQGAIYELYASPNFVSSILLEPGEALNNIAAGDTSRWMVTQADTEGSGGGRTIVLLKPQAVGLRTNVVLITDRRIYVIEAVSQAGNTYSAQIAWSYPQAVPAAPPSSSIDTLNLNYRVRTTRGRMPVWSPTRVFDDGQRTYLEFAAQVAASDLPPLFVVTPEGAELVNYRVQGRRYVVDRVFDVGELRLGVRAPIVVRIERNPVVAPLQTWRRRHHP